MGKGRRLTISRSERFLGSHHESGERHEDGEENTVELELMEEDIWSVVESQDNPTDQESAWTARSFESNGTERRSNGRRGAGGPSVTSEDERRRRRHVAKSAPVNVPDWSKILKVESVVESMHVDVADDDWDNEMVPPHEYVARSRNGDGVSSVFLGVGRTLKGRDMRRVRDAVWSQTGFYG